MLYPSYKDLPPIRRGSHYDITGFYKENGVGVDLTSGYSAEMQIRPSAESTTLVKSVTSSGGGIVLLSDGSIEVNMTYTETVALTIGEYFYQIEMTFPSGRKYCILEGRISIIGEVVK